MDFSEDVGVDFQVGQMNDFTAATAGTELERLRFVGEVAAKGMHCGCGRHIFSVVGRDCAWSRRSSKSGFQ